MLVRGSIATAGLCAVWLIAGCGSLAPPADLQVYNAIIKDEALTTRVASVAPVLYRQSKQHHAAAVAACEDRDRASCEHHSTMARLRLDTAIEQTKFVEAAKQSALAEARLMAAQRQRADQNARWADLQRRIARMERIEELKRELENAQTKADAEKARLALEAEKSRLAAEKSRAALGSQREKIELLTNRENLFEDGVSALGNKNVKRVERGIVMTVRDLFGTGRSTIATDRMEMVTQIANLMKKYPNYRVVVEGYTDSRGRRSTNVALSQARAQMVINKLIETGIQPDRLNAVGYGPARAIADNSTSKGRAQNRRVEVIFLF